MIRPTEPHGAAPPARLSLDTSPEAERLQVDLWRGMSPLQKARTISAVTLSVQRLSLAGIHQRHPGASDRECMLRLAVLKLGPELARRVYPEVAALLET